MTTAVSRQYLLYEVNSMLQVLYYSQTFTDHVSILENEMRKTIEENEDNEVG